MFLVKPYQQTKFKKKATLPNDFIFSLRLKKAEVKGLSFLLVDDISTTDHLCRFLNLKEAGAHKVWGFSLIHSSLIASNLLEFRTLRLWAPPHREEELRKVKIKNI